MSATAASSPATVCACFRCDPDERRAFLAYVARFRHHVPICDDEGHNVMLLPGELARIVKEVEVA